MANRQLGEMIEQLKQEKDAPAQAASLIALLEAKQEELREDATPEQVAQVVRKCIEAHLTSEGPAPAREGGGDIEPDEPGEPGGLLKLGGLREPGEPEAPDEDTLAFMDMATSAVKAFFRKKKWHYKEHIYRPDHVAYELGLSLSNYNPPMCAHIEGKARACRIEAALPLTANRAHEYLLCKAMAENNYPRRFESLQYNEADGQVICRYSYRIGHGVYEDDLEFAFLAVAAGAEKSYAAMKKHCIGKYTFREICDILENLSALVNGLRDDDVDV